jgi:TonB family protein
MASGPVMKRTDIWREDPSPAAPVPLPISISPKLDIGWGEFHQGLWSCIAALFTTPGAPNNFLLGSFFKDSWIESPAPRRALIAAALWHIAVFALPFPHFSAPRVNPALANTEITWSGPLVDLPPVEMRAEVPKPTPRVAQQKLLANNSVDAFHPRQRIFTDPVHPNHPRQTLINPAAPAIPPKFLPNLPNVVQLARMLDPARPRIEISPQMLRMLHPREHRAATTSLTPAPKLSSREERPADLALVVSPNEPARPKLEINASSAPLLSARNHSREAGPAPQLGPAISSAPNGASSTFIALSASPAPPAPVIPRPQGNLAARISVSPEGKHSGASSGSSDKAPAPGGGAMRGTMDVSISPGNPHETGPISGPGRARLRLDLPSSQPVFTREQSEAAIDLPVRKGPPDFAALSPGAKPELIFGPKRIYTMNINMPNLSSATGSWILHFSELDPNMAGYHVPSSGDLQGPEPLRKVDPKYPPTLMADHVEGEVVLYAVLRRDGSVDSIQLVRGIDPQLDANAIDALSQWKFRPAVRDGKPVDLEAIVYIPFHAPSFR